MRTLIVIRDNQVEKTVQIDTDLSPGDIRFLNEIGERIAHATGYEIAMVTIETKK